MITASIVGATGYTGALLTDILSQHPEVRLQRLTTKSYVGRSVRDVFPHLRVEHGYTEYSVSALGGSDVVFVCYPHAQAHEVVAELIDAGCRVVDLSADFRLNDPTGVRDVVWVRTSAGRSGRRGGVRAAREVPARRWRERGWSRTRAAIPRGCCSACLPVAGEIDGGVIVDSKSGVSGAGRTPSEKTHFCAVTENFRAYSEVGHRHTAEMLQELGSAAGQAVPVSFTPHLLPVDRGILSTIYFRPSGWDDRQRGVARRGIGPSTRLSRSSRSSTMCLRCLRSAAPTTAA